MDIENCPCCPNHCHKDNLNCGRGRDYFSGNNNESKEPTSLNEQVIRDIRKCGHFLHHSHDLDTDLLLANLTEEELTKLHELLTKIQDNM